MTIESKHLIEFSDIIALEAECKNQKCRVKLTLPLAEGKRFLECPVCHSDWLLTQTREEEAIRILIGALRDAPETLKGRAFSLKLQISATPTSTTQTKS